MIEIIHNRISEQKLRVHLGNPYSDMIKFVVDLEKAILALGGEMHSDAEVVLLENGSAQKYLWGGNIYPDRSGDDRLEYTSLINIRPSAGNRSHELKDKELRKQMRVIVEKLLPLTRPTGNLYPSIKKS